MKSRKRFLTLLRHLKEPGVSYKSKCGWGRLREEFLIEGLDIERSREWLHTQLLMYSNRTESSPEAREIASKLHYYYRELTFPWEEIENSNGIVKKPEEKKQKELLSATERFLEMEKQGLIKSS